ncbi:hypothetical protein KQI76_04255 [Amphibacillus sp. MSJ-3]|uniref:ATP-grasp fold amidoligase family protein n=1 Tax=Amphibacillus sp. MSJ-3 TaxID=2841505 RepID=UPI001C0F2DB4|nr:ATP-grasp fold amidoligase family protein [Amphibacillus sp. MSJ-3]MBU5594369.1 hypothetical protein [Amphibacillus sp. MSJ-3]
MEVDQAMLNEQGDKVEAYGRLMQETKRLEKDIDHLKNSRLVKFSKLMRPFTYIKAFFLILFRGRSIYRENLNLQKELIKKDYLLEHSAQAELVDRVIEGLRKNDLNSEAKIAELINLNGLTFNFIAQLSAEDQRLKEQTKRILDQLSRNYDHLEEAELEKYLYQETALLYKKARFPEYIVRQAEEKNISLAKLDSYSDSMVRRFRLKQLGVQLPDLILDDKRIAYRFVDQLGIARPEESKETFTTATLPTLSDVVIKPTDSDGGRGVYLVKHSKDIYDIKRNRHLTSWSQLVKSMQADLAKKWVKEDQWYYESLLQLNDQEPARDLKFYSFYGQIPLILEIKRTGKTEYCWWNDQGEIIETGKYNGQLFTGIGVTKEEIEQVKQLSKELPVPFMRIDFLRTEKGLVFGEFTPKPGHFDHFNAEIDQELGELYLQAEAELFNDLLNGKSFDAYLKIADIEKVNQ